MAHRLRRQLAGEVAAAFERCDILITAGGYAPAPKLDQVDKFYLFQKPLLTVPFDVTGHPAIGVRNGVSASGLPLGMQLVARPFDEATLLRTADAYERATAWHASRPPI